MIWLNIGVSLKKIRTVPLVLEIDLCSAISMESSRRHLFNDMAENRAVLINC